MEKLILARHGSFEPGSNSLNAEGEAQALTLANKLAKFSPSDLALFSSTGAKARQTAQIIAQKLHLPFSAEEFLGASIRGEEEAHYPAALHFLLNQPQPIIFVVTKGKFANGFFDFIGQELLQTSFGYLPHEYGAARVLEFTSKTYATF